MSDLINLENVTRLYDDFQALKKVSLNVEKGHIFGYLGQNGSGKTTTIKLILGLISPNSGEVKILGTDPYPETVEAKNARKQIGFMLEMDGLYGNLTGLDNLIYWAKLYGMKNKTAEKEAKKIIKLLKLTDASEDYVKGYSFGMRKRLSLGRALVSNPDILVLDEPTVGVDPESRYLIRSLMKKLSKEGKTIFFSSHDLEEVQKVCTHIAILKKGKIISQGTLKDVLNNFGRQKTFIRTKHEADAKNLISKLTKLGYSPDYDGHVISFCPKKVLNIHKLSDDILDTWNTTLSLEDVYLGLIKDNED